MNQSLTDNKIFRATIAHFTGDPWTHGSQALQVFDDGLLVVCDGRVKALGDAEALLRLDEYQQCRYEDYSGRLIVPGFIDTHLHYPQTDIIASHGSQLLEWLEKYTFPAEQMFSDSVHATEAAEFFVKELLRNGTTSAMMFATVHPESVDAIFAEAAKCNMRMATGKVMMDRNCPQQLRDTAIESFEQSQQLIDRWHGVKRLNYAVTPRFAPTSTEQQLEFAGRLFNENDGVFLQSHVAENPSEVKWVAELYPWSRSYLDVYDKFGLLGKRAIYAHCIYLDDQDLLRMSDTGTTAAFCPTSNLFLGSGLFDLNKARQTGITTGMATDVGGGTSFSMLRTADEAYKVAQMSGNPVTPIQLFYELTLGGAKAVSMEDSIGNFAVGKEADFTVFDLQATDLLARRIDCATTFEEKLFAVMVLGDDRCTVATHLMGEAAYIRQ